MNKFVHHYSSHFHSKVAEATVPIDPPAPLEFGGHAPVPKAPVKMPETKLPIPETPEVDPLKKAKPGQKLASIRKAAMDQLGEVPQLSAAPTSHRVAPGENLTGIAKRYGTTVNDLMTHNKGLVTDPGLIQTGWDLKLPPKTPLPAPGIGSKIVSGVKGLVNSVNGHNRK